MGKRLRRLLQSDHLAVWETFAAEVGGSWHTPGSGDEYVEIPHPDGPIVIEKDVTMVMVGQVMVPVMSTTFTAYRPTASAKRFSVSRADFATSVAEWFGRLDIQVDDETFDRAFVLKGDTPDFVRRLFADTTLRTLYLDHFEGSVALKDDTALFTDPTPGLDPLELSVSGLVDDLDRLRRLYTLFAATLTRVGQIGA
jgi:hypothetical protein